MLNSILETVDLCILVTKHNVKAMSVITVFITIVTRRVALVEQELHAFPEFIPGFSGICGLLDL